MSAVLERVAKILVPVDGSDLSMRAAFAALELARRYNDSPPIGSGTIKGLTHPSVEVTALYVVDIGPKFENFAKYGFDFAAAEKGAIQHARTVTEGWFAKIGEKASAYNLVFRSEVTDNSQSSIVGAIIEYAEREHVDVIVVGSKGQSAFTTLLIGSVSSGVVTYAPCTVIVVR